MPTQLNPYINFKDNTRQAMEFYHSIFGGNLNMSTFKDFQAARDPGEENLIMHSELRADNGITIMASDTPAHREYQPGSNFSMSLSGTDEAELKGYFEKLSEGGTITMPMKTEVWGDTFGMCIDKFGVAWLVNISASKA